LECKGQCAMRRAVGFGSVCERCAGLSASTSKTPTLVLGHVPATTTRNTDVSHDSDAILEADWPLRQQSSVACPTLQFIMLFFAGIRRAVQHISSIFSSQVALALWLLTLPSHSVCAATNWKDPFGSNPYICIRPVAILEESGQGLCSAPALRVD
jgi:hypothetical protein